MDNKLLSYYNHELAFIRTLGDDFSKAHPKVAGKLRIGATNVEDPHVSRLIESVALLNAHIKHKLDDEFPELSSSLLDILYPHYQAPIPSMAIAQFCYNSEMLKSSYKIKKSTVIKTPSADSTHCLFKTTSDINLWPIKLTAANIEHRPFTAPYPSESHNIQSVMNLTLKTENSELLFKSLNLDSLQFFINEQPYYANLIYEAIFSQTILMAITTPNAEQPPIWLDSNSIKPVGFAEDEAMLPYPSHAFSGYRLLTEFFTFSEKFLFFELTDLLKIMQSVEHNEISLHFYFKEENKMLKNQLNQQSFKLGCTPIINLFEKKASPIPLTHTTSDYLLKPDATAGADQIEIYSIENIHCSNSNGESKKVYPFYSVNHDNQQHPMYWHSSRKPSWEALHYSEEHTDIYLNFVDTEFDLDNNQESIIHADLVCTNADLPSQYPFKKDEPFFSFWQKATDVVESIKCIIPMSSAQRPLLKESAAWRLISHLSLNFLTLIQSDGNPNALKQLLQLYNFNQSDKTTSMIDGIVHISSKRITTRTPHDFGNTFWQGTQIILILNEEKFSDHGLFLFALVLERFFALYCSINSFSQLILHTKQRGEIFRWKPRAGEQTLL